jgi:hypothetical protein
MPMMYGIVRGGGIITTISSLALLIASPARAHTYVVTDTNDTTAVTSLRGAIIAANQTGGDNTIILGEKPRRHQPPQAWTFYLTIAGGDEDAAQTGDLDVTNGNLTVIGAAPNVTIDASVSGDRVFQVFSNAGLMLEDLVIKGGKGAGGFTLLPTQFSNGESGGAVYNTGTLILKNCIITGNVGGAGNAIREGSLVLGTPGGDGGGIYNSGFLVMEHCIITGNSAGTGVLGTGGGGGGGIRNDGICNLSDCQIVNNRGGGGGGTWPVIGAGGHGGNGGGIYNSGSLTMSKCNISSNICGPASDGASTGGSIVFNPSGGPGGAGGDGGGVYNVGDVSTEFCTFSTNAASNGGRGDPFGALSVGGGGGRGGNGGAIFNAGNLNLNTCTMSGNNCGLGGDGGNGHLDSGGNGGDGGNGGGIFNAGSLAVLSCTIVSNSAGIGGAGGDGGIFISYGGNPVGPISTNTPAPGGRGGAGGGIFNGVTNTATLANTLIALNQANVGGVPGTNTAIFSTIGQPPQTQGGSPGASGIGPDVNGRFSAGGFNLIGAVDGSTGFVNGVGADQVGSSVAPVDPMIGPLQMNGGPTPTHALLPGSPAIDQGDSFGIHEDQRGHRRPYNFKGIRNAAGGDGSDIGAFELDRGEHGRNEDER